MFTKSNSKTCFTLALFTAGIVLGMVFWRLQSSPSSTAHFPDDAALLDALMGKSEAEVRALLGEPSEVLQDDVQHRTTYLYHFQKNLQKRKVEVLFKDGSVWRVYLFVSVAQEPVD
jgi:hypothetical protein